MAKSARHSAKQQKRNYVPLAPARTEHKKQTKASPKGLKHTSLAIFESHWIKGAPVIPDRRIITSNSEHTQKHHPELHSVRLRAETLAMYYLRKEAIESGKPVIFSEISPGSGAWRRKLALRAVDRQNQQAAPHNQAVITYKAYQTNLSSSPMPP